MPADGAFDLVVGHARDQEVLPDREPDIAVAERAGDACEAADLVGREAADRQHHADPVQAVLLLRMHADMGGAIDSRARRERFRRNAVELAAELLLGQRDHLLHAEAVDDVFEPRLVAVGAVAVIGEHAHDRVGHLGGVGRAHDHAGLAREILVTGDAAEHQPEPDARLDAEAVLHRHGLEADVVGVLERGDDAAAVIGDVELARQPVERALVEDVEVPLARIGPRVDQLLRVDAGGRRAGHVADVVGAGAARAQAEVRDRLQHGDRVLRLDLADLDVGAGGDVGVAAAVGLGEIGEAGELPVLEDAVRDPQAAHVRALRRRHVEQAVVAPAEIVRGLRRFVLLRLFLQPAIGVERMLLALEFLLVG